jgi:undecaprenyl-diphosphatase
VIIAAVHLTVPTHLTWLQAIVIGFVQGITELFPVSSLGHSVLIPELFGWHDLVRSQDASESFWLAFIVGLHVANALALLVFFWRDWVRVIRGFVTSLAKRRAETSAEKLAWLIIVAIVPVGILGLLLEHKVRDLLAKPLSAAIFLMINGVILLGGERVRRASVEREKATEAAAEATEARLARLPSREAGFIGIVQCLALIAGISRDGVTMVAGLVRGLDNEDAAKFAFMLSTPVILAAGILKVGDLTGPLGDGVRGQIIAGTVVTFVASLFAVRFLSAYFKDRGLNVFGIYCLLFGAFMTVFVVAGL